MKFNREIIPLVEKVGYVLSGKLCMIKQPLHNDSQNLTTSTLDTPLPPLPSLKDEERGRGTRFNPPLKLYLYRTKTVEGKDEERGEQQSLNTPGVPLI